MVGGGGQRRRVDSRKLQPVSCGRFEGKRCPVRVRRGIVIVTWAELDEANACKLSTYFPSRCFRC